MTYQRKSRNGSIRVVEQLNRLFPNEAPWRYRWTTPPFWLGTAGTTVSISDKNGNYTMSSDTVLTIDDNGALCILEEEQSIAIKAVRGYEELSPLDEEEVEG